MFKNIISRKLRYRVGSYSVWEYLLRLSLVVVIAISSFLLLENSTNQLNSFVYGSISFFIITIASSLILLKSRKWVWFYIFAFIIKLTIGLLHYLYFIDPNYFEGAGNSIKLHTEFQSVYLQILEFSHSKIRFGIFCYNDDLSFATHPVLLSFISIPFVFFGDYILTIAPLNSMASLIISMNILLIAKFKFGANSENLKFIAIFTAFFPLTLITSYFYRDVTGFMLMSIGLCLIILSKNSSKIFMLMLGVYLFSLQRNIYALLLLLGFVLDTFINRKLKNQKADILYKVLIIIGVIISIPLVIKLSFLEVDGNAADHAASINFLVYPFKLILGLIGPFPWTQFLLWETIPEYSYQLGDYLMAICNIAIIISFFQFRKTGFKKKNFNLLNITAFLLTFAGLLQNPINIGYLSEGIVFMIPWIGSQITLKKFSKNFLLALIVLILLNVFVIAFVGSLSLSSLWS